MKTFFAGLTALIKISGKTTPDTRLLIAITMMCFTMVICVIGMSFVVVVMTFGPSFADLLAGELSQEAIIQASATIEQ